MDFYVDEVFLMGKKDDNLETCEDAYVLTENLVAVIDGCTALSDKTWNGKAPGRFAAETLKEILEFLSRQTIWLSFCSAHEFFLKVNELFLGRIREVSGDELLYEKGGPSAMLIVFNAVRGLVWTYGDCQCYINGKYHCMEKKIDNILSSARKICIESLLSSGKYTESDLLKDDISRKYIFPLLQLQTELANNPHFEYGYPVIDGYTVNKKMIREYIPEPGSEIVLASDGYPRLEKTLEKSEKSLAEMLKLDPLCYKFFSSPKGLVPGNQSFDDRCYIRIELEKE